MGKHKIIMKYNLAKKNALERIYSLRKKKTARWGQYIKINNVIYQRNLFIYQFLSNLSNVILKSWT